ncbi:MAG: hypothetical protein SV775_05195 [Thermodesulfobacteriota bacterium]|nr:hypothetical protein [Thermodesulfobacteriota bacterium]
MENQGSKETKGVRISGDTSLPRYEPPRIVSYTSEEILEQIGPAQACSPSPCATAP